MSHNEVAAEIVDAAFKIHQTLGPGLLEHVYQTILVHELGGRGLEVEYEVVVPVKWDGLVIELGYRADLIVNRMVLIELKSIEKLMPVHKKQVLTYLKLAELRLGMLINFGEAYFKNGVHRVANGLVE